MSAITLSENATHRTLEDEQVVFMEILENRRVTALFQPIVHFQRQSIIGFESLIRGPSDSPLHHPLVLFDAAIRCKRLTELDLLCRRQGIKTFKEKQFAGKLFLNTTPQGLLEPAHRTGLTLEFLQEFGLTPENVVIELTEQYPLTDFSIMGNALAHYRRMGFQIAIDDLGAGYSSLRRWSELRPEYVKLDRHFISDINQDPGKQSFVKSISSLAQELGCRVVAEGIETAEEFRTLLSIGIEYGQGYYFGKPQSDAPKTLRSFLFDALSAPRAGQAREGIRSLLKETPHLQADALLEDAYERFANDRSLSAIAVLNEKSPVGLLRRSALLTIFSTQYGRALHGSKSVASIVDTESLAVEAGWSIEQVSQRVTSAMQSQLEADFIIVDNGLYLGTGSVLDLLKKITDLQLQNARYANPLTLLPGNVPIYEHVDQLREEGRAFAVAYCDIDNFKPYNDVYGYAEGDRVIGLVAELLRRHIRNGRDFIGHVGGDDFIIIFTSENWQACCEALLREFAERIPGYYRQQDLRDGGIPGLSRDGTRTHFPLMTLSIGVVRPPVEGFVSHADIAGMATRAKSQAKKISGNSLFIERRRLEGVTLAADWR